MEYESVKLVISLRTFWTNPHVQIRRGSLASNATRDLLPITYLLRLLLYPGWPYVAPEHPYSSKGLQSIIPRTPYSS
jgi:hypothetical protein